MPDVVLIGVSLSAGAIAENWAVTCCRGNDLVFGTVRSTASRRATNESNACRPRSTQEGMSVPDGKNEPSMDSSRSGNLAPFKTPASDSMWDKSFIWLHMRESARVWPRWKDSASLVVFEAEWVYFLLGFISPSSLWTFYRVKRFKQAVRQETRQDTDAERDRLMLIALDQYLFAQLVFQVILLVVATTWSFLSVAAAIFALLRVVEIFGVLLRIVLVDTRADTALAATGLPRYDARRVVRLAASIPVYFVQVGLAFATASAALLVVHPTALKAGDHSVKGSGSLLYFSWTTLTTLGNNFSPQTPLARALIIAITSMGVLILVFALGICVGSLRLIFPAEAADGADRRHFGP